MEILANLLMVLLAIALIGMPFLKKTGLGRGLAEEVGDQAGRKELLFSALGEIEFDYRMNKLDTEDYEELKAGYQREALSVMDREDKELETEMLKKLAQKKGAGGHKSLPDTEDE